MEGELTLSQLATKHGVYQAIIAAWLRRAIEGLSGLFLGKAGAAEGAREGEIDKMHAKICPLVVEQAFFARSFGR